MAYLSDFDISGYGLSAQRFRMNVISSNIANANTTRTAAPVEPHVAPSPKPARPTVQSNDSIRIPEFLKKR